MASEKELFVTKQYVPLGQPMVQNDHTIIYRVKCMAERNQPEGILKMYRGRNIKSLYDRLMQLDYSEWPHIYAVKYFDESTLVVEEFLQGATLAELMDTNRQRNITFNEAEAYQIMDSICDALQQLNKIQPPLVHYNLKPSNIFITNTGAAKFLDFVPGKKKQVFSFQKLLNTLGAIFHEMLTGKAPSHGKCIYEGRYEPVIRKCLEKNPAKSYSDIKELQEDIEDKKINGSDSTSTSTVKIPYHLTVPVQGFIIGFEWLLFAFFRATKDEQSAGLFFMAFLIHSIIFIVARHRFLQKQPFSFSWFRRLYPFAVLVGVLLILFLLISIML